MSENKKTLRVYFKMKIFEKPDALVLANCDVLENFDKTCPVLKTINLIKPIPLMKLEYVIDDDPNCARRVRVSGIKNSEMNYYTSQIMRYICSNCEHNVKTR